MTLEQHLTDMLQSVAPVEDLDLGLSDALGCQLVGEIRAPRPVPHFAVCTLAGYAVAADAPVGEPLKVVDRVAAGFAASVPVTRDTAIQVAAGAPVPEGAAAVVPAALLTVDGQESVQLKESAGTGTGMSPTGTEIAEDQVVLAADTTIDARAIGVLAALGLSRVTVRPRPRVVILTTGSGLVAPGAEPLPGLSYDALGVMLAAAAREAGGVAFRVGPVEEEERPVRDAVEDQLVRADLIVVTGSIADGDGVLRSYLSESGTIEFDDESTNLGSFGHGPLGDDNIPCLALPQDPAAAMMLFTVLAPPLIAVARGVPAPKPFMADLAVRVPRDATRNRLLLAGLDHLHATPLPTDRPTLLDLHRAQAIIRIAPGDGVQASGERVPAIRLSGSGHP